MIGAKTGLCHTPGLSCPYDDCGVPDERIYRRFAVRYSFHYVDPGDLGAAVLEIKDLGSEAITGGIVLNGLIGAIVAGCVGYVCIKTMLTVA